MLSHTITTYVTTIPPLVIVVAIALGYIFVAGGTWTWPMLLDAALLAIYYWKPATWPTLLLIGVVRHVPFLAREVAVLCRLHEYSGATLHIALFVLPALQRYADGYQTEPTNVPAPVLPPMVEPKPAPVLIPEVDLPLLLPEALKALNADPTAPHVGVIGATRLGKTTFVGVLLAYRQGGLVIATPKSAIDDPWFGAEVARPAAGASDLDYSPIDRAITQVHQEMLRRNQPGVADRTPINLILDEWPELAEIPGVVKKVVQLIRRGAAAGIRLIFIATDVNVRSWRMDGMAGVLDNLVFARVEGDRQWSIGRLDPNWRLVSPRRLDTSQVHGLAARVSLAGRGWVGARVPAGAAPDPLLGGLLAGGVPVPVGGVGGMGADLASQTQTNKQTNAQTDADQRIALYRQWRAAGIKRDQARLIRQGLGDGLDDAEWAEAGKKETT